MATSMYSRALARRRGPAAVRRWSRDLRAPALRLPLAPLPEPGRTAPLPPSTMQMTNTLADSRSNSNPDVAFAAPKQHVIMLREIQPRETMPFVGRVTACPYLECRSSNRRCLSADPAPVSLERQVRHCFSESHHQCRYYRKARGLPKVPPNQAAFYTAAAVLLLVLVAIASL